MTDCEVSGQESERLAAMFMQGYQREVLCVCVVSFSKSLGKLLRETGREDFI